MVNPAPRTWVAGEVVTAAELNTEVRDAWLGGTWAAAATNFTVGNGTLIARYFQVNKLVTWRLTFTAGSTSTFAGALTVSLPVPARAEYGLDTVAGTAYLIQASGGSGSRTGATAVMATVSSVFFVVDRIAGGTVTSTVPWTWTTGDRFSASGTYEAA